MTRNLQSFSSTYAEARQKFIDAAKAAGATLEAYVHPTAKGPNGEVLSIDVARMGSSNPHTLLVTSSGVHGIEGYCGSGGQISVLNDKLLADMPPGVAVVHVHALNPYGFAHSRRTNEDNVDLNRNFIDWNAPRPAEHPLTAEIYPLLLPSDYDGADKARCDAAIEALIAKNTLKAYQAGFTQGQYRFADGLYYGGKGPVWSHQMWRQIIAKHSAGCRNVVHVDLHTGLGPYGYGELIFVDSKQTPTYKLAHSWWGDSVTSVVDGNSTSTKITGDVAEVLRGLPPEQMGLSITIEFGTVPVKEVLDSLAADNWLTFKGDMNSPMAARIKRQIRYCFYGEEPVWKGMIIDRVHQVLEQAKRGISDLPGQQNAA